MRGTLTFTALFTIGMSAWLLPFQSAIAAQDSFFDRKEEGWFFYEPIPEEPEEPELVKKPEPKPTPAPVAKAPESAKPAEKEPAPLSTAWIRENFQNYVDKAVDDPSPENVRAVMYLQRAMMDKGNAFADATERVVMGDPYLDEISRRPIASYGANKASKFAKQNQEKLLEKVADSAGIYFVYSSTCKFCIAQAPVLKALERKYGLTILPISIDGMPLPTGDFPEYKVDNGQAKMLNVQKTPALFLVKPELGFPNGFAPISQGAISMGEAENRIALAALNAGWIDESEYNETRPVDKSVTLADNLDHINEEDLKDPDRLVSILRERLKNGGTH